METPIYAQNLLLTSQEFEKERDFWRALLNNINEINGFPPDDPQLKKAEKRESIRYSFPETLVSKLLLASKGAPQGLFLILLSGVIFVLHHYSGDTDLMVGIPVLRPEQPAENPINQILPLRIPFQEQNTFREMLLEIKEIVGAANEYQNFPFEVIAQMLKWNEKTDWRALLKVVILLENIHDPLSLRDLRPDTVFTFTQTGGELNCVLEYQSEWHQREIMARLPDQIRYFLEQVLANPQLELTEPEIVTAAEKQNLLYDFNQTQAEYPADRTVIDLFEAQVTATPENIAVVFNESRFTYQELNGLANQIAAQLCAKGIKANCITGLMLENSPELVIGLLGILKAGGAYLPLDPSYPKERLSYMIEDSGIRLMLTQAGLAINEIYTGEIFEIELAQLKSTPIMPPNPPRTNEPGDLAYIIYTSGSTGRPKGTLITQQGLTNYLWWAKKVYFQGKAVNFPLYSSLSFDLTVTALYTPLITGGKLLIHQAANQPLLIQAILADEQVEAVKLTPAHLQITEAGGGGSKVRKMIVGGEDLKTELASLIHREFNENITIYNEYGPTETVVGCMIHIYDPEKDRRGSVPIGVPADNVQIYLLDRKLRPVPMGVAGEIYIGGAGVARGYLNQPELTAEKFIPNPFTTIPDRVPVSETPPQSSPDQLPESGVLFQTSNFKLQTLYRTGDLGRMLTNGKIEFLGRIDQQVKLRGYRIELGEIENRLLKHPAVKETVVIDKTAPGVTGEAGSKYLCAYIVWNQELTVAEMKEYLSAELPEYMIPTYLISMENLPLTTNGKIDRKALASSKLPEGVHQINTGVPYVTPRNDTETELVKIWQEILGIEKIGVDDNFFQLGGHSLKATNLVTRIHQSFNLEIKLSEVFTNQTVAALASLLQTRSMQADEIEDILAKIENMSDEAVRKLLEDSEGTDL